MQWVLKIRLSNLWISFLILLMALTLLSIAQLKISILQLILFPLLTTNSVISSNLSTKSMDSMKIMEQWRIWQCREPYPIRRTIQNKKERARSGLPKSGLSMTLRLENLLAMGNLGTYTLRGKRRASLSLLLRFSIRSNWWSQMWSTSWEERLRYSLTWDITMCWDFTVSFGTRRRSIWSLSTLQVESSTKIWKSKRISDTQRRQLPTISNNCVMLWSTCILRTSFTET